MKETLQLRYGCPVLLGACLLLVNPAVAQTPTETGQAPAPPAVEDRDPAESVLLVMKSELARAEARAAALTDQLVALDGDIESRVDRIISLLASARDSSDGAGSRLRKSKEDALAGIKATAVYYAQERDKRLRALETLGSRVDEDMLAREVAALNGRIETRVTQSLAIAESLVQHREGTGSGDFRETQEQRKVRYDAQASVKIKADLVATLRASIEKQTREMAMRDQEMKATVDPRKREQLMRDNEAARQVIAARRAQIEDLATGSKPATRPVGGKAAFELDQLLDEMTVELRRDFAKFKILVVECADSRARVYSLRTRVEQAGAMREANTLKPAPAVTLNQTNNLKKGT